MSMKKNIPSNAKTQDMNEADGQRVPAAGSTGKTKTSKPMKNMTHESEEQEAGRNINNRTEEDSSRTDSGTEETNY
jgi:hypothetical protein